MLLTNSDINLREGMLLTIVVLFYGSVDGAIVSTVPPVKLFLYLIFRWWSASVQKLARHAHRWDILHRITLVCLL